MYSVDDYDRPKHEVDFTLFLSIGERFIMSSAYEIVLEEIQFLKSSRKKNFNSKITE